MQNNEGRLQDFLFLRALKHKEEPDETQESHLVINELIILMVVTTLHFSDVAKIACWTRVVHRSCSKSSVEL